MRQPIIKKMKSTVIKSIKKCKSEKEIINYFKYAKMIIYFAECKAKNDYECLFDKNYYLSK